MRYGILADIHGNLEGLKVALETLDAEGHDVLLCLGDVIGYNANPSECVEIVRERCKAIIQGNHERMVLGGSLMGVRKETLEATEWTKKALSTEQLDLIRTWPDQADYGEHILLVHGSPRDKDEYILSTDAIRENISILKHNYPDKRVCFFGHSHYPMVIGIPEVHTRFHETRTIQLDPFKLYLINPGSVGQPRDSCPLASFGLYDDEAHTMTIFRKPYEIGVTQKKIRDAGIDERLASRLEQGK